ncbi:hypothetical protein TWF718_000332 [Orbilia javanica]|uniref:NAD(P)-binding protein n=1 Tax=Orbilia javanica TaxID=47235 RepID=A0AAN8MZ64_9PEZI
MNIPLGTSFLRTAGIRGINPSKHDMSGLSVLVTGGEAGLGREITRLYLILGADHVYITVRDIEKGEEAISSLMRDKAVLQRKPRGKVHIYGIDFGQMSSVKSFCEKFCSEVTVLHIAVLNAEANLTGLRRTFDILEGNLHVNLVANAILSAYLVPLLKANSPSKRVMTEGAPEMPTKGSLFETLPCHLTWLSSKVHSKSKIARGKSILHTSTSVFDAFLTRWTFIDELYLTSKFVATAYALELARRVGDEGLVVNAACPGQIKGENAQIFPIYLRHIPAAWKFFNEREAPQGAIAVVQATLCGPKGNGTFWSNGKICR